MEYEIVTKESFSIIGIELKTTANEGRNFIEISRFWDKVLSQGQVDDIPDKKYPGTLLGICMDLQTDGIFSYIIGAEADIYIPIVPN